VKYSVFLLTLLVTTAQAEVYKSIDANGEVIYSDVPSRGAKRIQVPDPPTYTPAPLPPASPAASAAGGQADTVDYREFSMRSPHADETIRSNAGIVNLSVSLEPALQVDAGHRIQYFLDDKPQGKPVKWLTASYRNIDRGTHNVSATVVDEHGAPVISTTPVTIHLLRASIQNPNNPLNPATQGNSGGGGSTGGTTGSTGNGSGTSGGSGTDGGSGTAGGADSAGTTRHIGF